MNQEFDLIAKTFQGLEEVLAKELEPATSKLVAAWFLSQATRQ